MKLKHSVFLHVHAFRRIIQKFLLILALASSSVLPAFAKDKIYFVDVFRVVQDSLAGKNMSAQLEKLAEERATLIRPVLEALEAEKKSLEAQIAILAPNQLGNNSELQKQIKSFQTRYQDFELRQRRMGQELQLTRDSGLRNFNEALQPATEALARKLRANMIVDKRLLLYGGQELDATDQLIERLNRTQKTIEVKWETLKDTLPATEQ